MFSLLPLLALLLAAPPTSASPEPVSVVARAGRPEVGVGEAFALELRASGPPGTLFTFAAEATDDTLELRSEEDPAPLPGVHRYRATVFTLGEAEIPPIPVSYRLPDGRSGQARSQAVRLKVLSALPRDPQQQKLADIRGPLPVAIGLAFWLALPIAALLLAAGVRWLLRRRRRAPAATSAPVPEVPPDQEALRAFAELAASPLLGRGEYREFYIRLTAVAKRYLERRLAAPVLEMTTAETLAFLRRHPHGDEVLAAVRDLAEAADRIKFARGAGLAAEAQRHLTAARELVAQLEERLRPPQPAKQDRAA